jgi:hypothetical protein
MALLCIHASKCFLREKVELDGQLQQQKLQGNKVVFFSERFTFIKEEKFPTYFST